MTTNLERIKKFPKLSCAKLEKIATEVAAISVMLANPVQAFMGNPGYHFHKVQLANGTFVAADAKAANRQCNSGGRGDLRYLFDLTSQELYALAEHSNNGQYRIVVKFN